MCPMTYLCDVFARMINGQTAHHKCVHNVTHVTDAARECGRVSMLSIGRKHVQCVSC